MPKTLETKTLTLTPTRSCERFDVVIPTDGTPPFLEAYFVLEDKDESGQAHSRKPAGRLRITKDRLLELLPGFGLPSFPELYASMSQLLHSEKDLDEEREAEAAAAAAAVAAERAKPISPPSGI